MWIVKNNLRATISFRGLDVSIPAGEQFDLDTIGRDSAQDSNQVQVAFEEGYLENVYKASATDDERAQPMMHSAIGMDSVSTEHFNTRLDAFKDEIITELRAKLPQLAGQTQVEDLRDAITHDVQQLVGELKLVRDRFATVKHRIQDDHSLSDAEVKARLAFLEEQERELMKNFESVGRQVERDDGDVMDKADLLSNL